MKITGLEANLLLYALDEYLGVDEEGKLQFKNWSTYVLRGYTMEEVQSLRDRLFNAHEHPEEAESAVWELYGPRDWRRIK